MSSQVNQITANIAAKETGLASLKRARDGFIENIGYQVAQYEHDIYELNIQLQLAEAEAEAEEDEGWNTGLVARQAAAIALSISAASLDADGELCYQGDRAEDCVCEEPEPEIEFQEPAHREGTKLKWISSVNPETYSVAIVKKDGILEVKRVTDGAGHCHNTTVCQCRPCSEICLSNRLGAPMPPWLRGAPLIKTFFTTETEWRASLPGGGLRGSIQTTVPAISERTLKKLCVKPLTGTTDGLKMKELKERFPGGTMVLTTATEQLEIEHIYYDIATYPEDWRHQIYTKKHEQAVFNFRNLGDSVRANGKPQLMVEWRGLYIDLSHLF